MKQSVRVRIGCVAAGVAASAGAFAAPSHAADGVSAADAAVRVVTDPQTYQDLAGGRAVVEDFTADSHFPIVSCRLDSRTREAGLQPGDIEPGVVYSTSCTDDPESFELNIDAASFEGGFLDGFHRGQRFDQRALRVSFTKPVHAFGFDTNELMGHTFRVRIVHTDGRVERVDGLEVSAGFSEEQFYGFVGDAADIERVRIRGTGHRTFGFALDDFRFNPPA